MSDLQKYYKDVVVKHLLDKCSIKNTMNLPKFEKIVINVGAGEAVQNPKSLDFIQKDLTLITGQKPVVTKAKKSIAGFKLREGMPIGVMVTLRGKRMYDFCSRLISIVLPRIRDFKGINSLSFDGNGNYTLSIKEHLVFPEIDFDKTDKIRGLGITIVTSAKNDVHCKLLLQELGFIFK